MVNIMMVDTDRQQLAKMHEVIESSMQFYDFFAATTAREGLQLLGHNKMDVIVLDTGLPDLSGLEMARQIRLTPGYEFVWIILLSADQKLQTEAFKNIHCYDYVIKPYDTEELFCIIDRLSHYRTILVADEDREYVTFRQRDQYIRIMTKDILYIEVIGNNSTLYTYSQIYCLRKMSLRRLKMMLPDYFVQCHKSFIVNRNYIEAISKGPYGWQIMLKDYDKTIPSGEKYKNEVLALA